MSHLVCNGSKLYRRASKLVRTPITISLQPDAMAVYQVGGTYTAAGWADSGFTAQSKVANVWGVGADCLQAYLNHTDSRQCWHSVTTSHLPETVWYQGAYSTSSSTKALSFENCEAYLQLSAYRFTIPEGLADLDVTAAEISFTNGGGVQAYQGAYSASSNNSQLKGKYSFSTWYTPFHVLSGTEHETMEGLTPQNISASPSDASVDLLADTGEFKGSRDLWGFSGTTRDGGIVTLTSPTTKSYSMGTDTLAVVNSSKCVWICPFINASYSGSQSYSPYYVNSNNGYWGCVSLWGLTAKVTVD